MPHLIDLPTIHDVRGNLCVAQSNAAVPFDIKRCYWICDVPSGAERGGHAHISTQELLVAVSGSFAVNLDDGVQKWTVMLNSPTQGLLIEQGVWRTIDSFSGGAVCLVMASDIFSEEDYIRDYHDFLLSKQKSMPPKLAFLDLAAVNAKYSSALKAAAARVIDSGQYIGGPEVEAFEQSIARLCHAPYAIGVSNGLDALRLIFRGYITLGMLAPGDEVIVPANTYVASVLAITDSGLIPKFVDPDAATYNLAGSSIASAIGSRTRAIMPVHLYGRVAWDSDMANIALKHGLLVIEDNAQAIGASCTKPGLHGTCTSGGLGHAAAISFYPTKNLGALGDAGAVVTHHEPLARAIRALANYGADRQYHNVYAGLNCRLDPMQAAMLNAKLPCLDAEIEHRRRIAEIYLAHITNPHVTLPMCAPWESVWHQFVIRVGNRVSFREYLRLHGVDTAIHYPVPPHRQPCYADQYAALTLPVAEMLCSQVVSLPISNALSLPQALNIADIINHYENL